MARSPETNALFARIQNLTEGNPTTHSDTRPSEGKIEPDLLSADYFLGVALGAVGLAQPAESVFQDNLS